MYKKIEMKFEDMDQVSGGMIWPRRPDGPGVINPSVPIIPGMLNPNSKPIFPGMPNPFAN